MSCPDQRGSQQEGRPTAEVPQVYAPDGRFEYVELQLADVDPVDIATLADLLRKLQQALA